MSILATSTEPIVIVVLLGLAVGVVFAIAMGLHKIFTKTRKSKEPPPSLLD